MREGHFVVCGLGRFGLLITELLREKDLPVLVVTDTRTRSDRKKRAEELGATLQEGDFRFPDVLEAACVTRARAVLLAASGESENLETALDIRRNAPRVRIVMRLASDKLAERLRSDFAIDAVLSPSVLAAREITRVALDLPPPEPRPGISPRAAKRLPRPWNVLRPEPRLMAGFLVVLFLAGVAIFRQYKGLSIVDAIYFTATIMTTVGFGDYDLQYDPDWIKLFGSLLMFSGISLIAVLSSFLTNFFLSGSAAQRRAERIARGYRDHVIVCGIGSVGYEVVQDLMERHARVVVVDKTPNDVYLSEVGGRAPVIIGDATHAPTLVRAGIDRARALVAATSDDAINLEMGLVAQSVVEERRPGHPPRLILRCFDPDLAARIHAISDAYTLLSAAEIAAPIFVAHAVGKD